MKKLGYLNGMSILAILLTLSAHAASLPWMDLDEGNSYELTQKITLGNEGPSFPEKTGLALVSKESLELSGNPVLLYKFQQEKCPHPEWVSDMEIITPTGNDERSAVGVLLGPYCQWEIYVEQKDLLTNSFLLAR